MTTFANTKNRQSGFTLIEIVMVMAIVGILAATAIPSLGTFLDSTSLDTAARSIQTDLRYAQMLAQTTGEPYGFRATSLTQYEVYEVSTGNVVTSPYDQMPLSVDLDDIHTGVRFTATSYPAYEVEFSLSGTPSSEISIGIVDTSTARTQTVDISLASGLIMRNNPT